MKKQSSFSKALAAANKSLEQANAERTAAQERLSALNAEIPALQRTIAALQAQLHPDSVTFCNSKTGQQTTPSGEVRVPAIPPELIVPPEDLSGMGSIPAVSGAPARDLTDDELLGEPEGVPLAGE